MFVKSQKYLFIEYECILVLFCVYHFLDILKEILKLTHKKITIVNNVLFIPERRNRYLKHWFCLFSVVSNIGTYVKIKKSKLISYHGSHCSPF